MSYNPSLLLPIDRIRFRLGDTNDDAPLLPDETYTALLAASGGDERLATIAAAEALIAKVGQNPTSVGADGASAGFSERLVGWKRTTDQLRAEIAAENAANLRGFSVARPTRGDGYAGEYYAGGRLPPEDWA